MFQTDSLVMQTAKKAIESTYTDTCDVIERHKVKVDGVTKFREVRVVKNQPCRLSFSSITQTTQTDQGASLSQSTKLFISPDVVIKEGSKIVVARDGNTLDFKQSGVPAVYGTHKEIMLEVFKEWA